VARSLIRSRAMITHIIDRHSANVVPDGAVLQEDGTIIAVGAYGDLARLHPTVPVIGSGQEILLPGFVNGHHHVGLTPVQLGSPDMPLELWFVTRMVARNVNPYLDTLYSAFEMIASGVTTVQHIHGWAPGALKDVESRADELIRAYHDVGMRVSYCYAVREQNRLVYQRDEDFVASLPSDLRGPMQNWYDRFQLSLDDHIALFENLHGRYQSRSRTKIQLAPANLHWCSDAALERLAGTARQYDVPLHMHLLETAYQKEYASRRSGGQATAVEYLERFGLLGPHMTLGHATWLNERDIDRLAETGTCVCHNCSSNFRLRSGVAALNVLEAKGVTTAIGMDEAGLNDDRDMLQEMRLVLRAHRVPGMDDDVPTTPQVLRMATVGGAMTTPYGDRLGTLAPGKAADMVLLDWQQIAFPYLDEETPLLDAVMQRAKTQGVRTVICDGAVIYADGTFTKVDHTAALRALHDDLAHALADDEVERRKLSKALLPHVKAFYAGYFDADRHVPFYRPSSRV
jgi:5-methylthioadenosine/S-adenosylhomocysteine deaminase